MKFKRGDVVIVDPLNTLKQSKYQSTILGIVLKVGFRKATIMSIESYDVIEYPKRLLYVLPSKDVINQIRVVERSDTFCPKFTDMDIEFVCAIAKDYKARGYGNISENAKYLVEKMQADRRDSNIKLQYNLFERTSARPNTMYGLADFVSEKSIEEWREINHQVASFVDSLKHTDYDDLIADWFKVAESCEDKRITDAVDEYFEGVPVSVDNVVDCLIELSGADKLTDLTEGDADIATLVVLRSITLAAPEERAELAEELLKELPSRGLCSSVVSLIQDTTNSYNFSGDEGDSYDS